MIVVVGGAARKVGKTRAVCQLIEATRAGAWIAVKITSHSHGADLDAPVVQEEHVGGPASDSARYLAAGARRAFYIRSRPEHIAEAVRQIPAGNWVIESNAVVQVLTPDLMIYVRSAEGERKPSAVDIERRADYRIDDNVPDEVVQRVLRTITFRT